MNKILGMLCLLIITSCAQYEARIKEQEKQQAGARLQKCINYGFKQGTDSMANCLMYVEQSEEAQKAATSAALLGIGNQYLQTPPAATQVVRQPLSCTTHRNGAYGNINCY